jgi:hypothetical protein
MDRVGPSRLFRRLVGDAGPIAVVVNGALGLLSVEQRLSALLKLFDLMA